MYPYIQWAEYINALLPPKMSVYENETIVVANPIYFKKLEQLLQYTPKRTISNFLMWRVTVYSSFYLTAELRKRSLVYTTIVGNEQEQKARWKECVDTTRER